MHSSYKTDSRRTRPRARGRNSKGPLVEEKLSNMNEGHDRD